ncbi:hypothetical protein [Saccharopolyspora sp. NPDC049426]|uniref:hypothetical protein n=1 Tax=Saccharopolyspora sp. NPDC049426 TaxID=3155652 RepID=UPI00343EB66C
MIQARHDTSARATRIARTAIGGFVVMAVVGSMYGMSAPQFLFPERNASDAPVSAAGFGVVCLGLAIGTPLAGRLLRLHAPRTIATAGAVVWSVAVVVSGLLIGSGGWALALVPLIVGGVGVGLTYLAVVDCLGPQFPHRPLVGAAIGPAGFTTGTAAVYLLALFVIEPASDDRQIGTVIAVMGAAGVALSLTGLWLPTRPAGTNDVAEPVGWRAQQLRMSILLAINAMPGMLLLSVAFPLVSAWSSLPYTQTATVLTATVPALFFGGLVSPWLSRRLSSRGTFVALLTVRAVALVVAAFVHDLRVLIPLLAIVLVGHGSGFAVLPGIVRSMNPAPQFASYYGTVLTAWGISGAFAALIAVISWAPASGPGAGLLGLGILLLVTAAVLARGGIRRPLAH